MGSKRRAKVASRTRSSKVPGAPPLQRPVHYWYWRTFVSLGVLALVFWVVAKNLKQQGNALEKAAFSTNTVATVKTQDVSGLLTYCAVCHTFPDPSILPKDRWPYLLKHMNMLVDQYRLGVPLTREQLGDITSYYVARAPAKLPKLGSDGAYSPIRFAASAFGTEQTNSANGQLPMIGDISIVDLDQDQSPDVLISDIGNRKLTVARRSADDHWVEQDLAAIAAPAGTAVADMNGDGHLDIVVADLGSVMPTESPVGRVLLLINDGRLNYTSTVLLHNVPRVTDVAVADIDQDGTMDILVSAYGLFATGQIGWLQQTHAGRFAFHALYLRNGVSHVAVADFNDDGLPDFAALVSQQHEEVLAFINQGNGVFEDHLLYKAPHPMWGSSSLELVDLDRDNDIDVLLANGDALDNDAYPKPYHGVQWLENEGDLSFAAQHIANFYGAYRATAGDLDGDGDLDIVVTSMLNEWNQADRQSMIWLENNGNQQFAKRKLARSPTSLVTAAVGDLTGDGRIDVIAGGLHVMPPHHRVGRVTLWTNLGE